MVSGARPALIVAGAFAFLCAAAPAGAVTLYDQYDHAATAYQTHLTSQDFEFASNAYDDQAADDFVVPAGQTWRITGIDVDGEFTSGGSGSGPPASFTVSFYQNSGNVPTGSALSRFNSTYVAGAEAGDYSITLSSPVFLDAGTYWVSVQARQDASLGDWWWHARTTQSNQGAVWQNPGNGWGYNCTTWTRTTSCAPLQVPPGNPDLEFRLSGSVVPNYSIRTAQGASMVSGVTDVGNHCDDNCLTAITLPFPFTLYGVSHTTANVDANGILQFGGIPTGPGHPCLPAGIPPSIVPYWSDLETMDAGAGVFTKTIGTAPHRTFVVEWRAHTAGLVPVQGAANFEIQLHEGSQTVTTVYGTLPAQTPPFGVGGVQEGPELRWKQFACNSTGLASGLQVDYIYDAKTLSVAKSGAGAGSVTSDLPGISCGATCSSKFSNGDQVTLTPHPAAGSAFTGWAGACSGTGSCVVTMSASRSVTANFTPKPTLTVAKSGSGAGTVTSSPAGIDCGSDCSEAYLQGTSVTLTATPSSGAFAGWSGGGCSGTGTCVVAMDTAAQAVDARFTDPPDTRISKVKIDQGRGKFAVRFAAVLAPEDAGAPVTLQCKLIRGHKRARYHGCTSPAKYTHLQRGRYIFKVRAVNGSLKDPTPAKTKFRIRP